MDVLLEDGSCRIHSYDTLVAVVSTETDRWSGQSQCHVRRVLHAVFLAHRREQHFKLALGESLCDWGNHFVPPNIADTLRQKIISSMASERDIPVNIYCLTSDSLIRGFMLLPQGIVRQWLLCSGV